MAAVRRTAAVLVLAVLGVATFFGFHVGRRGPNDIEVVSPSLGGVRPATPASDTEIGPERPETQGDEPAGRGSDEATGRPVRIRGRLRIVEPAPDDEARRPRSFAPTGSNAGPPLPPGASFESVRVGLAGSTEQVSVSQVGSFLIEAVVPRAARTLTLRFQSSRLLPESGNPDLRVPLGDAADVEVDVPMIATFNFQPTFHGKPIRPADLKDPEIEAEFFRQLQEAGRNLPPPPPPPPPDEATEPAAPSGDSPGQP